MADEQNQSEERFLPPDLRDLDGALRFLDYHSPSPETRSAHEIVNTNFQTLLKNIWQNLPAGPGLTRAIHAINRARMECNVCISSKGA